ncbi:hypothetical protein HL42_1294 [Trichophyton rubrum]|nr:hypothetical protein HL42_1294 [Trichophyton rubrum]
MEGGCEQQAKAREQSREKKEKKREGKSMENARRANPWRVCVSGGPQKQWEVGPSPWGLHNPAVAIPTSSTGSTSLDKLWTCNRRYLWYGVQEGPILVIVVVGIVGDGYRKKPASIGTAKVVSLFSWAEREQGEKKQPIRAPQLPRPNQ